ncbi:methyltransferase domain-containing protein [Oscillatoria amoena NRMC-F 0135]|nr:class I SAM-dependent methyltransferase [Oscillatoria laete-virens]MDL5051143.1 methyltransferase domain-containing protein [Oscillatoria amoena NRMC-F 0135]MDL5055049.1 methyltransferase domain-containing protein [Oscillatoria laete-virens NRMC-F 0139]
MNEERPFYYSAALYDRMVDEKSRRDISFWLEQAKTCRGPVLELFCGTGQIARALARGGCDVTGVDISPGLLRVARRKQRGQQGGKAQFVRQDVTDLHQGKKRFPLIIAPMGSMGHLTTQMALRRFFRAIQSVMEPGGVFVFDVPNPMNGMIHRRPDEKFFVCRYRDPVRKCEALVEETGVYDSRRKLLRAQWRQSFSDGRLGQIAPLTLRVFPPAEINGLLAAHGCKLLRRIGDYDGSHFRPSSPRQIVFCRRK